MELTAIDIKNLVLELENLKGGKIQKVYQTKVYDLILDFYTKMLPRFFYLKLPSTIIFKNEKVVMPSFPLSLAKRLRSHLNNARIKNVEQINNDRIIKFFLEGKKQEYSLILELFSKGNIILLNKNEKIIVILRQETFKDRILKPGKVYVPPKNKNFVFNKKNFMTLLEENKDKHFISLLSSTGLGGKYSEKILKSLYKKNYKKITYNILKNEVLNLEEELKKLYSIIEEYFETKKYYFEEEKKEVFLYNKSIDEKNIKIYDNILLVLKKIILKNEEEELEEKKEINIKKDKTSKKIEIQKKRVEELEEKSLLYEEKGKKIFENYIVLKETLDYAKKYKEKKGNLKSLEKEWPENFPKLKKINVKENKITIEI